MAVTRMQCKREIDATICKLKKKREALTRADARRMAVRGHIELKPTAKKYRYACIREEYGREGGQNLLIQHNGNFKKLLHRFAQIYNMGGRVQSVHFTDDWETTSCGYWTKRKRAKAAGR